MVKCLTSFGPLTVASSEQGAGIDAEGMNYPNLYDHFLGGCLDPVDTREIFDGDVAKKNGEVLAKSENVNEGWTR